MFLDDYENVTNCIVIDTETVTDRITNISKVWEIGVVVIKDDQIIDTKDWVISPDAQFERLDLIYPEGHMSIEVIKASPKFADLYDEMKIYLDPIAVIGGHNTDYDVRVINRELALLDKDLIGTHKIDTIRLARKVHPDWKKYNLDYLSAHYGLDIENRHRALDDAYATAVAFLKMKEELARGKKVEELEVGLF